MKIFRQLINAILICFLALNFAGCEDILDGNPSHSQQPGTGNPDGGQGGNGNQDEDQGGNGDQDGDSDQNGDQDGVLDV